MIGTEKSEENVWTQILLHLEQGESKSIKLPVKKPRSEVLKGSQVSSTSLDSGSQIVTDSLRSENETRENYGDVTASQLASSMSAPDYSLEARECDGETDSEAGADSIGDSGLPMHALLPEIQVDILFESLRQAYQ